MTVTDAQCVAFLRATLPRLQLRWEGFRRVRGQLKKRLARRVQALRLSGLDDYRMHLEATPAEWEVLDGLCRITISRFFRDRAIFGRLREEVLPALAKKRSPVRIWSAGCCSGEEAWTLAALGMTDGIEVQILASDANETVLERARAGVFDVGTLRHLPPDVLTRALQPVGAEAHRVDDRLRASVSFERRDLRGGLPVGPFDLLLCRNVVLTYFEAGLAREVVSRMLGSMSPWGRFVIGGHEQVPDGLGLVRQSRGVYAKP